MTATRTASGSRSSATGQHHDGLRPHRDPAGVRPRRRRHLHVGPTGGAAQPSSSTPAPATHDQLDGVQHLTLNGTRARYAELQRRSQACRRSASASSSAAPARFAPVGRDGQRRQRSGAHRRYDVRRQPTRPSRPMRRASRWGTAATTPASPRWLGQQPRRQRIGDRHTTGRVGHPARRGATSSPSRDRPERNSTTRHDHGHGHAVDLHPRRGIDRLVLRPGRADRQPERAGGANHITS